MVVSGPSQPSHGAPWAQHYFIIASNEALASQRVKRRQHCAMDDSTRGSITAAGEQLHQRRFVYPLTTTS